MNDETLKELFFNLAAFAIDRGLEVRLENSRGNSIGDFFSNGVTDRNGLSLYVYQKDMSDEAIQDDQKESEDADDE